MMDRNLENKTVFEGEVDITFEPHDGVRIVEGREDRDLSRSLKQRHIQMIALAGAIVSCRNMPHD